MWVLETQVLSKNMMFLGGEPSPPEGFVLVCLLLRDGGWRLVHLVVLLDASVDSVSSFITCSFSQALSQCHLREHS